MKNIFKHIFGKPEEANESFKPCVAPDPVTIVGLSEADYNKICGSITEEFNDAKARQKSPDAAPTKYMLGLTKALELVQAVKPHHLGVQ